MQTVFDGTIPIVTMELTFKETTKLTRVDMEGASFTDKTGIGNSGTYTRDTDRDYTGVVTY